MKIAPVADVKARLSSFLDESRRGPVVITRNGKAVAVLVSVESDEDVEDIVVSHSTRLHQIIERGRQQIREGRGIPHDDFWKEVNRRSKASAKKNRVAKKPTKAVRRT